VDQFIPNVSPSPPFPTLSHKHTYTHTQTRKDTRIHTQRMCTYTACNYIYPFIRTLISEMRKVELFSMLSDSFYILAALPLLHSHTLLVLPHCSFGHLALLQCYNTDCPEYFAHKMAASTSSLVPTGLGRAAI
jgi:hypothetical protein